MASVSVSKLLNALGVVLLIWVLNRSFVLESVGVFFFFYVAVNFLSNFVGGVGKAIRKRVSAREGKSPAFLAVGTVFALVFQTAVSVLVLVVYVFTPTSLLPETLQRADASIVLSAISLLFAQSLGKLMLNYNSGLGYPSRSEWFGRALPGVLFLLLAVVIAVYNGPLSLILLSGTVSYALSALILYAATRPPLLIRPTREHARSIFDFGKWSTLEMVSNNIYNSADVLLLGALVTSASITFYESSNALAGLLYVVPYGLFSVSNVMISGLDATGRSKEILAVLQESLRISSIIPIMAFFLFLGFGDLLLEGIYGGRFGDAYWYLVGLGLIKVLTSYRKPLQGVNYGTDSPEIQFYANVYGIIANFTTVLPLIWYFGGLGVVISTVMAGFVRLGVVAWLTREYIAEVDIRWSMLVTYSTGVVLLVPAVLIKRTFVLNAGQYAALVGGFVILYLVSSVSLLRIDLSDPISATSE